MVFHSEDETGSAFRPRKQREVIGAEVKHDDWSIEWGGRNRIRSRPIRSAVVGLTRQTPPVLGVISTARRLIVAVSYSSAGSFYRFADAGCLLLYKCTPVVH
jgi:hypothetical protein